MGRFGLEGAIQFFPLVLLLHAVGVIGGISRCPEGLVEGLEAIGGRVVRRCMGMGRGGSVLVALGLAVHLIKTMLFLGEEAEGRVNGFFACLSLDQFVYMQDDLLSHSVNISYKERDGSKD